MGGNFFNFSVEIFRGPTHITKTDVRVSWGDTLNLFQKTRELYMCYCTSTEGWVYKQVCRSRKERQRKENTRRDWECAMPYYGTGGKAFAQSSIANTLK